PNQLYIDPEECINCGVCEPECPFEAIFEDEQVPEVFQVDIDLNAKIVDLKSQFAVPEVVEKPKPTPEQVEENKKKWGSPGWAGLLNRRARRHEPAGPASFSEPGRRPPPSRRSGPRPRSRARAARPPGGRASTCQRWVARRAPPRPEAAVCRPGRTRDRVPPRPAGSARQARARRRSAARRRWR